MMLCMNGDIWESIAEKEQIIQIKNLFYISNAIRINVKRFVMSIAI